MSPAEAISVGRRVSRKHRNTRRRDLRAGRFFRVGGEHALASAMRWLVRARIRVDRVVLVNQRRLYSWTVVDTFPLAGETLKPMLRAHPQRGAGCKGRSPRIEGTGTSDSRPSEVFCRNGRYACSGTSQDLRGPAARRRVLLCNEAHTS